MSATETPWFLVTTTPVRKGWYKLKTTEPGPRMFVPNGGSPFRCVREAMRYWNGKSWQWQARPGARLTWASVPQSTVWCGLMEPAK